MTPKQRRKARSRTLIPVIAAVVAVACIVGGIVLAADNTYTMTEVIKNTPTSYYKSVITIKDSAELAYFAGCFTDPPSGLSFDQVTFKLLDDVEIPEYWELFMFGFNNFDGNGHKIYGINIQKADAGVYSAGGLFSSVHNCTIKNLTVEGEIHASTAGGICATAYGNTWIDNCTNNCTIDNEGGTTDPSWLGGIVGWGYMGNSCYGNDGTGSLDETSSGVHIANCVNNGAVTALSTLNYYGGTGGIIGGIGTMIKSQSNAEACQGYWQIQNCVNDGAVTDNTPFSSGRMVGGIIGCLRRPEYDDSGFMCLDIIRCINTGKVTTTGNYCGGIIGGADTGNDSTRAEKTSGLHDYTAVQIAYCQNKGEIYITGSQTDNAVAGLVGSNTVHMAIAYCVNYGDVKLETAGSGKSVGGLVGSNNVGCEGSKGWGDRGFLSIYQSINYGSSNASKFGGILNGNKGDAILCGVYSSGTDGSGVCKAVVNRHQFARGEGDFGANGLMWAYNVYCQGQDDVFYDSQPSSEFASSNTTWTGPDPTKLQAALENCRSSVVYSNAAQAMSQRWYDGDSYENMTLSPTDRCGTGRYVTSLYSKTILQANYPSWGYRLNDDTYGSVYMTMGSTVKLNVTVNGNAANSGHEWCLMQDDEVAYVEYYSSSNATDAVYFYGVEPGEYQVSMDGKTIEDLTITVDDWATQYNDRGSKSNFFVQTYELKMYQALFAGANGDEPRDYTGSDNYDTGVSEIVWAGTSVTTPDYVEDFFSPVSAGLYLAGWTDSLDNAMKGRTEDVKMVAPGEKVTPSDGKFTYYPVLRQTGVKVKLYYNPTDTTTEQGYNKVAIYRDGKRVLNLGSRQSSTFDDDYVYVCAPIADGTYEIWVWNPSAAAAGDPRVDASEFMFTGKTFTYSAAEHSYEEIEIRRATVTYDDTHRAAGDTRLKTEYTFTGLSLLPPDDPESSGYAFLGWTTKKNRVESEKEEPFVLAKGVTKNTALYALWHRPEGAVVRVTLDGDPYLSREISLRKQHETLYDLTELQARPGMYQNREVDDGSYDIFVDDVDSGHTVEIEEGGGSASVTFYSVKFHINDSASTVMTVPVIAGQSPDMPAEPQYVRSSGEVYGVFGGWYTDSACTKAFDSAAQIERASDVYAKVLPVTGAEVFIALDGSAYNETTTVTLRKDQQIMYTLQRGMEINGYRRFFFTEPAVTDGEYEIYLDGVDTGRSLTVEKHSGAVKLDYVTIAYRDSADTVTLDVQPTRMLAGDKLAAPVAPEIEGKVFRFWSTEDDSYGTDLPHYNFDAVVDGPMTLYGVYEDIEGVKINYTKDGLPVSDATLTLRKDKQPIYLMEYDSGLKRYIISGGIRSAMDGEYRIYINNVDSGKTIQITGHSALLDLAYYTVTFVTDGTDYAKRLVFSGDCVVPPEAPKATGKQFTYWTAVPGDEAYDFDIAIDCTTSLYAEWKVNDGVCVTVTQDGGAYANMSSLTLRQNSEIRYELTKDGSTNNYRYDVHVDVADGEYSIYINGQDTGRTLTVKDHSGSAVLTYYTVIYYNGSTVYEKQLLSAGSKAVSPDKTPTKQGKHFEGWKTAADGGVFYDFALAVDHKLELYASWKDNEGIRLTVTLNGGEYTGLTPLTLRQDGQVMYTLTRDGSTNLYRYDPLIDVDDGEYNIYFKGQDTGKTLTVKEHSASLTLAYYTVTFHTDSTVFDTQLVLSGGKVKNPSKTPTAQGKQFNGWQTSAGKDYDYGLAVDGPLDLYAAWTANEGIRVAVTVDGGAYAGMTEISLRQDSEIKYELTRDGATNDYRSDSHVDVEDGEYAVYINGEDTGRTVTVKNHSGSVTMSYFSVTYYANSTVFETRLVLSGTKAPAPAKTPTMQGKQFETWKTAADKVYDFGKAVDGKLELYAAWKDNEGICVTVTMDDSTYLGLYNLTLRQDNVIKYTLSKDGSTNDYRFDPTVDVEDGEYAIYINGQDTGKTVTVKDHSGSAVLSYYSVIFHTDVVHEKQLVLSGGKASVPAETPTAIGKQFVSWKTAADADYDFGLAVDARLELYAAWQVNDGIRVTVTVDGGAYSGLTSLTLRQDSEIMYTLTRDGTTNDYRYDVHVDVDDGEYAIYINGQDTGKTVTVKNHSGSTELHYFSVTYHTDSAVFEKQLVLSGTKARTPAQTPTAQGKQFTGWQSSAGKAYDFGLAVDGALELYASWKANEGVCVTLTLDGGTYTGLTALTLRQNNAIKYTLTRDGSTDDYRYDVHVDVEDGEYAVYINGQDTGRTVTVKDHSGSTVLNYFSVTFRADSAVFAEQLVLSGAKVSAPAKTPTAQGKQFGEWQTSAGKVYDFGLAVDGKLELYASWKTNEGVCVTVTLDDSTYLSLYNLTLRQDNVIKHTLSKDGSTNDYRFDPTVDVEDGEYAIYINGQDTGKTVTVKNHSGSAVLSYYSVVFHTDAIVYERQLVLSGGKASAPAEIPTAIGKQFETWKTATGEAYNFGLAVDARLELYAAWKANEGVCVTLTLNGGSYTGLSALTLRQNSEIRYTLTKDGATDNYRFDPTVDVPDGSYAIYINGQDTGRTVTVKNHSGSAVLNYFSVTFHADSAVFAKQLVLSGTKASAPADVPTAQGKQFDLWKTAADKAYDFGLAVDSKLELYAEWKLNEGICVTVTLDGAAYTELNSLTLREDKEIRYTLTKDGSTNDYRYDSHVDVPDGEYAIYINGEDTGKTLSVREHSGSIVLNYFSVTFHTDGTVYERQLLLSGSKASVPSGTPTATGKQFEAWKTSAGKVYDFSLAVDGKLELYAAWKLNEGVSVQATLDGNPYTGVAITLRQEQKIRYQLTDTGSTGEYRYAGTDDVADGGYAIFLDGRDTGRSLTVKNHSGSFALDYFTVSFNVDSVLKDRQIVLSGCTATLPTWTPTAAGKLFGYWKTSGGTEYSFGKAVDAPLTLDVYWSLVDGVNITLSLDDAAIVGAEVTLRVDNRTVYTLKASDVEGKIFRYVNKDTSGNDIDDVADGTYQIFVNGVNTGKTVTVSNHSGSADVAYYTVTFMVCTSQTQMTQYAQKTVLCGDTVSAPGETPVMSGKMFNAWSLQVDGAAFNFKTAVDHKLVLYSTWMTASGIAVKVTRDGNDYTAGKVTLRKNDEVVYTLVYSAEDKCFTVGEKETKVGDTTVLEPVTVEDGVYDIFVGGMNTNRTLEVSAYNGTAVVTLATVSFYSDSGLYFSKCVPVGSTVSAPTPDPTSDEGEFLNWATADGMLYDFGSQIDGTLRLYAQWELYGSVSVTVTVDGAVDSAAEVTLCREGETVYTLSYNQYNKNYRMATNTHVADGTYNVHVNGKDTGRTLNVTKHAGAAKVSFVTVSYFLEDKSTIYKTSKELIGSPLKAPKDPEKTGFVFACWTLLNGEQYDFTEDLTSSMSLFATWENMDFGVSAELKNAGLEGRSRTVYSAFYSAMIVPDEGYMVPESITVTMNEDPFDGFEYDPATGIITIPAYTVCGDLAIKGEAVEILQYHLENYVKSSVLYGAYADTRDGYTGILKANTGYSLPKTITARMKDQPFDKFRYDPATGVITVEGKDVTGTLTFSGECQANISASSYKVISAVGHGKAKIVSASVASALVVQITPDEGYGYPETIMVTAGTKRFTDYSYDAETGTLTIGTGKVTNIVVAATCPGNTVSGIKLTDALPPKKKLLG